MATNKFAQECKDCGAIVLPGKGILTSEWSNQDDDTTWVVRHADKSICGKVAQEQNAEAACIETWNTIKAYIQAMGSKINSAQYGNVTVCDKRTGYNQVGWVVTTDNDGTLYMTSKSNLDGYDMSETYTMTETDDDNYDNSNAAIVSILTALNNGQPASNLAQFAI